MTLTFEKSGFWQFLHLYQEKLTCQEVVWNSDSNIVAFPHLELGLQNKSITVLLQHMLYQKNPIKLLWIKRTFNTRDSDGLILFTCNDLLIQNYFNMKLHSQTQHWLRNWNAWVTTAHLQAGSELLTCIDKNVDCTLCLWLTEVVQYSFLSLAEWHLLLLQLDPQIELSFHPQWYKNPPEIMNLN